MGDGATASNPP